MKSIVVLSRPEATSFTCDRPWACISIATEQGAHPQLNTVQRKGLLQLVFADLVNPTYGTTAHANLGQEVPLFNEDHAREILDFVGQVWDKVELLMIHCNVGMSRSPAVAAAIDLIFNRNRSVKRWWEIFSPNFLVFDTILCVWENETSGTGFETLFEDLSTEDPDGDLDR